MKLAIILLSIILFCSFVAIAILIRLLSTYDGSFIINTTDPKKDVYTLSLDTPILKIHLKNKIIFKVIDESDK